MNIIYGIFIAILIILKFVYTFVSIYLFFDIKNSSSDKYQKINTFNSKLLIVSECGLFLLLLIVFFPFTRKEIIINWHEKLLFFFLGMVGLLHTNYRYLFSSSDNIDQ